MLSALCMKSSNWPFSNSQYFPKNVFVHLISDSWYLQRIIKGFGSFHLFRSKIQNLTTWNETLLLQTDWLELANEILVLSQVFFQNWHYTWNLRVSKSALYMESTCFRIGIIHGIYVLPSKYAMLQLAEEKNDRINQIN